MRRPKLAPVVVVVEDESLIRLDAAAIIERAGYPTVEASDANQALHILERSDDIGLLYTDVTLPGSMDGVRLAWTVHRRWPSVKILVTSGRDIKPSQLPPG